MAKTQIRPDITWGRIHVRTLMMIVLAVGVTAPSGNDAAKSNGYILEETKNSTSLILFHRKCLTKPEVELRKQLDKPADDELAMEEEQQQRQLRSIMAEEGFVDDLDHGIDSIENIGQAADVRHAQADSVSASYSRKLFGGVVVSADGMDDYQNDGGSDVDVPSVTKVLTEVETTDKRKRQLERKRLRTLKRKSRRRKNRKKDADDFPPWHCEMKTEWLRMPDGYFPQYVQTGKCARSKCMFGMYKCRAKRYVIRVLRKNPLRCNPVPTIGFNSTYEEAWEVLKYKITICCECSLANSKRKGRKKDNMDKDGGAGLHSLPVR